MGVMGALLVLGMHGQSIAQGTLTIGGSRAHFGTHAVNQGFMPDPKSVSVTSGGNLNVSSMGYGPGCRGYATATPDVIVNWTGGGFLRFYVQAAGDTTLIINDANGRWHCNDDTAGTNPQVDLQNAPSGQYDIWIGSYQSGQQLRGNLYITELSSNGARAGATN